MVLNNYFIYFNILKYVCLYFLTSWENIGPDISFLRVNFSHITMWVNLKQPNILRTSERTHTIIISFRNARPSLSVWRYLADSWLWQCDTMTVERHCKHRKLANALVDCSVRRKVGLLFVYSCIKSKGNFILMLQNADKGRSYTHPQSTMWSIH